MKKIILARHGETEYNRLGKVTGQLDIPLNNDGLEQAMMLSVELKDVYLDVIFSSPLKRCRQTVSEIKKFHRGIPLIFDDRLKECHAGVTEGKLTLKMHEYSETFTPRGGESFFDLKNRIYDFIEQQIIGNTYNRILIVSHGGPIKIFRSYFENTALLSAEEMSIKNAKYWVINLSENKSEVLR